MSRLALYYIIDRARQYFFLMPIARSLAKVHKRKADSNLHPRGRKIKQLTRATLREQRVEKHRQTRQPAQQRRINRLQFIKTFVEKLNGRDIDLEVMHAVIQAYVDRLDQDIEELERQRRPGRPKPSKLDSLLNQKEIDGHEYEVGFELPNLLSPETLRAVLSWQGSLGGLSGIKEWVRLARNSQDPVPCAF